MPIPGPDDQMELLCAAVEALAGGDPEGARRDVDLLRVDLPGRAARPPIRRALQVTVLRRDRFTCRYCGTRTVPPPVLRAVSLVWPNQIPFNPNWRTDATHPLYVARASSIDHLHPHAHGGVSDQAENLVTACWTCNLQKSEFTLDRLGWTLLDVTNGDWDGLTSAYPMLWEHGQARATDSDVRYHTDWLKAFATR